MLTRAQARRLKAAGLDYYNHNLDTSPEYYGAIITTRTYQDRLDTLGHVRDAGIHVCCGGIVGMGESAEDRVGMIATLASLPAHPESVPINMLVQGRGHAARRAGRRIDPLDFVRTIAVARITMPKSVVRLSAGREDMSEETQALCFLAGANSIFYGPKLLTTPNPGRDRDMRLMDKLGLVPMERLSALTRHEVAHAVRKARRTGRRSTARRTGRRRAPQARARRARRAAPHRARTPRRWCSRRGCRWSGTAASAASTPPLKAK